MKTFLIAVLSLQLIFTPVLSARSFAASNSTAISGNEMITDAAQIAELYSKVCAPEGVFNPNLVFTTEEKVINGQTVPTNCGQAAYFFQPYFNDANALVIKAESENFGEESKNCADCQVQNLQDQKGPTCSTEEATKLKNEPCSFSCFMSNSLLSVATTSIVMAPAATALKKTVENSCPAKSNVGFWEKQKQGLKEAGSCALKVFEGVKKSITELGEALKKVKDAIAEAGTKLVEKTKEKAKTTLNKVTSFLGLTKPLEKTTNDLAHVASKEKNKDIEQLKTDEPGWLKNKIEKAYAFVEMMFKEMIYMGTWERESVCLNCKQKNLLKCEIAGRAVFDIFGFAAGAGVAVNIAKKTLPLVKASMEVAMKTIQAGAKSESFLVKSASKGALVGTTLAKTTSKGVSFVGKTGVKVVSYPFKQVAAQWKKLTGMPGFLSMKAYAESGKAAVTDLIAKNAAKKGAASIPGSVIITSGKIVKTVWNADQKVFKLLAGETAESASKAAAIKTAHQATEEASQAGKIDEATRIAMVTPDNNPSMLLIKNSEDGKTAFKAATKDEAVILGSSSDHARIMKETEDNLNNSGTPFRKTSDGNLEINPGQACSTKVGIGY